MQLQFNSYWTLRALFMVGLFSLCAASNAQNIGVGATDGWVWKDQATIQSILDQELAETNAALATPNLTDWASASLEAYRSMLTFTQQQMQSKSDLTEVLDNAFNWMKNESVANPVARSWVLDDMQAKKTELLIKMTVN